MKLEILKDRQTNQPPCQPTDWHVFFDLFPPPFTTLFEKDSKIEENFSLTHHLKSLHPHILRMSCHTWCMGSELPCLLDLVDTKFLNYGYPGVPLHRWTKYSIKQLHSCKCPRVMSRGRPTTPAKVNHWINFCPAITKLFQLHRTSLSVWSV